MKKLQLHQDWLSKLLPEGLPYPTSTLISGPGGSGKPLIGFAFVYDWIKAGGNVIFITLQYPETKFVESSLQQLYDIDINDHLNNTAYIQFDYNIDTWKKKQRHTIRANLLKPDVWETAVREAESFFTGEREPGTLVFASALNLLLFSSTYKERNVEKIERLLKRDKKRTYLFSVSTSAFREDISRWEKAADNLMIARMEQPMKLRLMIEKIKNREVPSKEIPVPMKKSVLEEIKEMAESARKRDIPKLIKI